MGQRANTNRRSNLDEKKSRAAGRQERDVRMQIRDASAEQHAKGKTAGASGRGGMTNRPSRRAASGIESVARSTKPARKRGR